MTELTLQLVEHLRQELQQYGEMLALLEEQQEHLMSRRTDDVVDSVTRIQAQTHVLRRTRAAREEPQRALARALGHPEWTGILELADYLPADYRPLLQALVAENNQLLKRVQQRGRQNHFLLSSAVDLMQQFLNSLSPGAQPITYGDAGMVSIGPSLHTLYEALG